MPRRMRRLAVRGDDIALLRVGTEAVHETQANDRVTLELDGQSLQEGAALGRMDRACGCLNGGEFVI
jgi:hypothetical protein